ncbi:MAG: glycosyltransferase [Myxococcota bacterium]
MRVLHVGCLPFPTFQGTQAAIGSMLSASAALGHDVHLLAYAASAGDTSTGYEVHRIPDFPRVRSLRSGPSWGKVALDARCVAEVRRLHHRLGPDVVVAHHVEAAVAALSARVGPVHYVAHTSLERELPIYVPRLPEPVVRGAARAVEEAVCRRAAGVGAVAPTLRSWLGKACVYLPVPWAIADEGPEDGGDVRKALGIRENAEVGLYAGNLDRYQGWEDVVQALALLRRAGREAFLLVATESDPEPVHRLAAKARVSGSVRICRLNGEEARRSAHAAANFAWIPRRTPGGIPIKLLDALGRGLPVITTLRATAGLPVDESCVCVANDDPAALAEGVSRLQGLDTRSQIRAAGFGYLRKHHDSTAFERAFGELTGSDRQVRRPSAPRVRASAARQAR